MNTTPRSDQEYDCKILCDKILALTEELNAFQLKHRIPFTPSSSIEKARQKLFYASDHLIIHKHNLKKVC